MVDQSAEKSDPLIENEKPSLVDVPCPNSSSRINDLSLASNTRLVVCKSIANVAIFKNINILSSYFVIFEGTPKSLDKYLDI
jgi:hypothetical protein